MERSFLNDDYWHRGQIFKICWIFVLGIFSQVIIVSADTISDEAIALTAVASQWQNPPQNWKGMDPCGSGWVGINCTNSFIVTITVPSFGLKGTLPGDIGYLPELLSLDLSYNPDLGGPLPASIGNLRKLKNLILLGCGFSGQIPPELGKLQRLTILALNSNKFSGPIPGSLGNMSSLYWLDVTNNALSGTLPISNGTNLGLDMLIKTKHFHFGNNKLSGIIPPKLFQSGMQLLHLIMDNNNFSGSIPPTLGYVTTLEALRLDRNSLSGPVPSNLNNLTKISELYLSNNKLTGPLPNLTGMNSLTYVDLSNNSFDVSDVPPWFSTLPSLTTLFLEQSLVSGEIPMTLFSFPPLQTVRLRSNHFNGTLTIGTDYSTQLQLVDLQNNDIREVKNVGGYPYQLLLAGNPSCNQGGINDKYCGVPKQFSPIYSTPMSCVGIQCPSEQNLSPTCQCLYAYAGTLTFRLLTVSNLQNASYYQSMEKSLYSMFELNGVSVDSVSLHDPFIDSSDYLEISLEVFPTGKNRFDQEDISKLAHLFSNQTLKSQGFFALYFFIPKPYIPLQEAPSKSKSSNTGSIIGASVGGAALVLILICLLVWFARRKGGAKKVMEQSHPFGSWDPSKSSGSVPQLKGARCFSFEELQKCTNEFSEANIIGSGGYGKVYIGTLPDGRLVAVKRAQEDSMQGGHEFKTEIELLTRVHHKNLVSLVGFCFDQGEQMLVYDYLPNGTIKESLSGTSGVYLDWKRRLRVTLDAARGLTYLHDLASPPIVHRDIKSTNILLDQHLNAKVSDFGLSKPLGEDNRRHVTTQVKGTLGYLDPEYYMTQQLTEKSDVYGFGVLMLELITAKKPIDKGKYIVREVRAAIDKMDDHLYGLQELIDPALLSDTTLVGLKRFIDLAFWCVEESGANRPRMSDVAKEIEKIMHFAGIDPNVDSASASTSYGGSSSTVRGHLYSNESLLNYSGAIPSSQFTRK